MSETPVTSGFMRIVPCDCGCEDICLCGRCKKCAKMRGKAISEGNSSTPRVDEHEYQSQNNMVVYASFARQLEREIAEAKAENVDAFVLIKGAHSMLYDAFSEEQCDHSVDICFCVVHDLTDRLADYIARKIKP